MSKPKKRAKGDRPSLWAWSHYWRTSPPGSLHGGKWARSCSCLTTRAAGGVQWRSGPRLRGRALPAHRPLGRALRPGSSL